MSRSAWFHSCLGPFLLMAITGCSTVGTAVTWPVKQTVLLTTDVTSYTVKTTVSLAADITKSTVKAGLDATVWTATETVVRTAAETAARTVVEEGTRAAIRAKGKGVAAAVIEEVLD